MSKWTVETIEAAESELAALPKDMRARFFYISGMLVDFGPENVSLPHVCHLEGNLWEMRMKGRDGISRAIYFKNSGRRLTVVRVFVKKTKKTPRREIDLAHKRMKEEIDGKKAQRT